MRPASLIALLALATAVAWPHRAHASCINALEFNGVTYIGHRLTVQAGEKLATPAIQPGCNDGGPKEPDSKRTAYRIRGVDPALAITTGGSGVYVSTASFPALKTHPLHKRLHYPDKAHRRKGARCTITGTSHPDTLGLIVRNRNGVTHVYVFVDTDVRLRRAGTGYVPDGTEITVTGRPCYSEHGEHYVNATRIEKSR